MFRLRAYGGLTLERDGAPYAGPATQRRRLAVLAMIAASDTGVSRERLTNYLWPDADPARGRHSLDDALSGLRRELQSDELFIGVATLRVNAEALGSDMADQAAALAAGEAERAAVLYAGPFLDGFYVPGAADFEHWVETERSQRARVHASVLEALATGAAERRDAASATRWWQARVALDPLDTPATLGLLGALTTAGNPAEALRLARVHEALVREELDASPGPEWTAAVEGLRAELARPRASASVVASSQSIRVADVVPTSVPATIASAVDDVRRATTPDAPPSAQHRSRAKWMVAATVLFLGGLASFVMWTRDRALLQDASSASHPGLQSGVHRLRFFHSRTPAAIPRTSTSATASRTS